MTKEELEAKRDELEQKMNEHYNEAADAGAKRLQILMMGIDRQLTDEEQAKADIYKEMADTHHVLRHSYYVEWLEVSYEILKILAEEVKAI